MNLSLDSILTNARELVSRLRRDDATADTTVSQAQYVQEKILSMKQVSLICLLNIHERFVLAWR